MIEKYEDGQRLSSVPCELCFTLSALNTLVKDTAHINQTYIKTDLHKVWNILITCFRNCLHIFLCLSYKTILKAMSVTHACKQYICSFQSNCRPAPFSHEKEAQDVRDQIDYKTKISLEDAKAGRGIKH